MARKRKSPSKTRKAAQASAMRELQANKRFRQTS